MKILIVEDNEDNIALFKRSISSINEIKLTIATSRDGAIKAITDNRFDLVVLDLKIPTVDGGVDQHEEHGYAVRAALIEHASGTPVLFFTAFETVQFMKKIMLNPTMADFWGRGRVEPLTTSLDKGRFSDCLEHIKKSFDEWRTLNSIEISSGAKAITFNDEQKRILRIFARMHNGQNVIVRKLAGGLSHALTCRVEVQRGKGAVASFAVAKLGLIADLESEYHAFHKRVQPIIRAGGFAHVIEFIKAGAGKFGGIFYGLASAHINSLHDVLEKTPANGPAIVERLRDLERPWQDGSTSHNCTVGDVRKALISEEKMAECAEKIPFDWKTIETLPVRINMSIQHGDLHGLNVLVKDGDDPMLIDYGEVCEAPVCLDPTILELSLLFHPSCSLIRGGWPTAEQAVAWHDLDVYVKGCPAEAFVRACRIWNCEVEPSDSARYATAYAFAVRQLKFPGVDHALAITLARGLAERLQAK